MENSASTVADLVTGHIAPQVLELKTPDGTTAQVLVLPKELSAHSVKKLLAEYRETPERRRGQSDLTDLLSFITLTKRFADNDSVIFVNGLPGAPSLLTVFDYHRPTATQLKDESGARFCEHRARYLFPLSDEWRTWTAASGKAMDQAAFAEWIENRIADIAPVDTLGGLAKAYATQTGANFASSSRLFELSKGLELRVSSKYSQHKNLQSGETQFVFAAEHQDESGAPLKVPGAFLIAIPVFKNDEAYQIPVRLRYRVKDGSVIWFFELYRHDLVFEDALHTACVKAQKETGLPLLYGAPESGG
jgi:uncharacterized protein YfdQ (DUF2303 family)